MHIAFFPTLIIMLAFFSACTPQSTNVGSSATAQININETGVSDKTEAEEIYINNCGNSASSEQISERSQAISIEGGGSLGVNIKVVEASVEGKYVSSSGVSKSQKVVAASNTNMKFVLLWAEQVSEGTVTINGDSGKAIYRVNVPISVEQVSAEDLGCFNAGEQSTSLPLVTVGIPTTVLDNGQIFEVEGETATWGPLETGIYIQNGDRLQISYLSGEWWIGQSLNNDWISQIPTDANGYIDREEDRVASLLNVDNPNQCRPLPSAPFGSLIGSIGENGALFLVGNQIDFFAQDSGLLYLKINYLDHNRVTNCPYGDGGNITVRVKVTPP